MTDEKPPPVDFIALAQKVSAEPDVQPRDLALLGGQITGADDAPLAAAVKAFLLAWDFTAMPVAVWEYMSAIDMVSGQLPTDYEELWRGRVFGEGGDLSLRRDGDRVLWQFVGEPATVPDAVRAKARDFWAENEGVTALRKEAGLRALLWGERVAIAGDGVRWHEDRVAAAHLVYPGQAGAARVVVEYDRYWHAGQPAFIRLRGLAEGGSDG